MSHSLEPNPELLGELTDIAQHRHLHPQSLLNQILSEWLARHRTTDVKTADTNPMLALFAEWDAEDETIEPEELARRNREWEETAANLAANRLTLRDVSHLVSEETVGVGAGPRAKD